MVTVAEQPPAPPSRPARDETAVRRPPEGVVARLLSNKVAVVAGIVLLLLAILAVVGPWLAPHPPNQQNLVERFRRPGEAGLLGTDELGRDVFSRLIVGARVSLLAATEATVVAIMLGMPCGMLAGYHGGAIDTALSRVVDGIMSVPFLILALTIMSVVGYGLGTAMLVVGVVFAPNFFRVARAATQDVRSETFIEASAAIGCRTRRIILAHVLPNSVSPLLVQVAVTMGLGVSAEASLSFLGLGVLAPTASWGSLLRSASANISLAPYLMIGPGVMITATVLALTLFGDGLRDAVGTRRIVRRSKIQPVTTTSAVVEGVR